MALTSRAIVVAVAAAAITVAAVGLYVTSGAETPSAAETAARGAGIYRDACASCHGVDLQGEPGWRTRKPDGTLPAPPHDVSGHTWHHPDQVLFDYTKRGGAALAPPGFKSAMPGFADTLSDADILAVLAFIKSRWTEREREHQRRISQQ